MNTIAAATILLGLRLYGATGSDPLDARDAAVNKIRDDGLDEARRTIESMLSMELPISSPYELTYLAELMKLTGDPRAPDTYRKAIDHGKDEPAVELLVGEYFRNFRGPMQPLAGAAERHLFQAKRKLACAQTGRLGAVERQLKRSIVSLYERDGLPLYSWITIEKPCERNSPGVSLFLSTGIRGGEEITDLDVDSEVRDLTSAAAYSQSLRAVALGPLNSDLLRQFLRTVTPLDNRNRLRMRYEDVHLDLFFNDRHTGDAAITNPYLRDPTPLSNRDLVLYDALKLREFGASVGSAFPLSGTTDLDLEGTYSRVNRTGLVDYLPNAVENINQVVARAAISRYLGPDKLYGDFTFVDQSITPADTPYQSRGRQIYAGTVRYQIYRLGSAGYSRVFRNTRGLELYAGALHDHENFGYTVQALVNRQDFFAGATIRGLARVVDLSIQPTYFESTVPQDPSRNNRQYRTAAYGLIRLRDEERAGPDLPPEWHGWYLSFLHLTIPIQSDIPEQGISAFANRKVGAELSAKWFTTARGGTTFLGSARYDVQQFTNLNRNFNLFTLNLTMGF